MDIGSGRKYPANKLSNFAPNAFVIDGVHCASMEGFLQSLKFDKEHVQVGVCKLIGFSAKKRGRGRNKSWQQQQLLWWKGTPYIRKSDEYQKLLERAFDALFTNDKFRAALKATGGATLTHNIGRSNETETVLTKTEFLRQLNRLRRKL